MHHIIDSRLANAFFENAYLSENAPMSETILRQIDVGRHKRGGLWVGGKSILTTTTLSFNPNYMNRVLHARPDQLDIEIPLGSIINISVQRGFISDTIVIRTAAGDLKIRCFSAKSFAAAIEATRLARQ